MAYNYLTLVNSVLQRVNEVPLTSSNFSSASGFYADVKNAVNLAINEINIREWEWPFNHTTQSLVLTPETVRYNYPSDAKTISFDTFRIRGSDVLGNKTSKLFAIDYEEYLEKFSDMEYRPEDYAALPTTVFRTRDLQFGLIFPPDLAYTLDYEYYAFPSDLEDYDDVPTIPANFNHTIHNGAMHYAYMFRGDNEAAALSEEIFNRQIENMRTIFINRTEYARSTFIRRG